MKLIRKFKMAALFTAAMMTSALWAGPIVAPIGATINSGGPGFGSISETFDQSGLSSNYISGVTDFDTYVGTNPMHTFIFSGFEWFSNSGTTSASVTYDLGSAMTISALALWNEEASGIGLLDLFYSLDGVNFFSLASGLMPTDHATSVTSYAADVFSFGATTAQYIRFDMSNCPQQQSTFDACAIGEVAFRTGEREVPVPAAFSLLLLGFGTLLLGRKKI